MCEYPQTQAGKLARFDGVHPVALKSVGLGIKGTTFVPESQDKQGANVLKILKKVDQDSSSGKIFAEPMRLVITRKGPILLVRELLMNGDRVEKATSFWCRVSLLESIQPSPRIPHI